MCDNNLVIIVIIAITGELKAVHRLFPSVSEEEIKYIRNQSEIAFPLGNIRLGGLPNSESAFEMYCRYNCLQVSLIYKWIIKI